MDLSPWLEKLRQEPGGGSLPGSCLCPVGGDEPPVAAVPLRLACAWDAAKPWPVERGLALWWRTADELRVLGVMEDSDVYSDAVGRNDRPWTKGDVLEFFVRPAGDEPYYELHLAPNLATLEYAIPGVAGLRECTGEELEADLGLRGETGRFAEGGFAGWWGLMCIPLWRIGLAGGGGGVAGHGCVCRYNYNHAWGERPECSSTAPFAKFNFHQPECWHELVM